MCHWYSEESTICGWHHLHFAHGIDHEAIKAKVRHAKRWPNGEPAPSAPPTKKRTAKGI
jgi:hypothetical protein